MLAAMVILKDYWKKYREITTQTMHNELISALFFHFSKKIGWLSKKRSTLAVYHTAALAQVLPAQLILS